MSAIEKLVQTISDGSKVDAGRVYNDVMAQKLKAALDAKKIEIASSMGKKQPEEES